MTSVGYSTLDVIPSVKNLRAQLEAQTSRDFVAAGRKGGQQFGDAAGKEAGGRFKAKFSGVAKEAFAPLAGIAAGAGIVSLFKDAISGASDLAESGNKVKVIFGSATDQVDKFASQGAKALGQTKLEVLDAASSFGVFGKAAGLSGSGLADFSTKLAGLSTDLASFFNTDPSQAVEAIGAGLRGESEPLRQFGVLLDDATLRQEALRQGLISTTKQALTPQQRVLAAYQVILNQTKDAQGDFARTSGGLANQQRILSAQWSEMKTELGSKLLPAATKTVQVFNNGVIPAIEGTGGVVADAVGWFNQLPAPVKTATGALVAFRAAQALGAGNAFSAGSSLVSKGLEDIRLRAMLVSDEYKRLRQGQLDVLGAYGKFTPAAGRVASALGAIEVGAIGAGRGLRAGLSGALGLVGGPWGAAFIAGAAVLTHFWQEHQKAKARVNDLTETLDKQTGAITENTRATAVKALQDGKAFDDAKKLGIGLGLVTDAALGNKGAMVQFDAAIASAGARLVQMRRDGTDPKELFAFSDAIDNVKDAVHGQSGVLSTAQRDARDYADAMKSSATASDTAATAAAGYTDDLKSAHDAVQKLLDVENKRRNANLTIRQDRLALVQQLQAAREQAAKGGGGTPQAKAAQIAVQNAQLAYSRAVKAHGEASTEARIADEKLTLAQNKLASVSASFGKTLDENTKAGQENLQALYDLASQWNNSAQSVKNAKGAYGDFRQQFVNIAMSMGDTKKQAEKLANQIVNMPKNVPIEFQSKGYREAMRELRNLRQWADERIVITTHAATIRSQVADAQRHATGGLLRGPGSGTSDSILMWGSNGEYMQRKAAVDYYGVDFMNALNSLQVPKYATGGSVGAAPVASVSAPLGSQVAGELRIVGSTAYITGVARSVEEDRLRAQRRAQLEGRRS